MLDPVARGRDLSRQFRERDPIVDRELMRRERTVGEHARLSDTVDEARGLIDHRVADIVAIENRIERNLRIVRDRALKCDHIGEDTFDWRVIPPLRLHGSERIAQSERLPVNAVETG
ncbi:MAG: hypothetical protein ABSB70_23650 [Candidatus Velthaea sp.]